MKVTRWLLGVVILVGLLVLDVQAIKISQIQFDLALPAGTGQTQAFTVLNDDLEPTTITVNTCDWLRNLQGQNLFCDDAGKVSRSASAWVSAAPTSFDLQPNESKEVQFTVTVPPAQGGAALDGMYWTALMVEGTPTVQSGPSGTTITVKRRFGVKVLATVAGTGHSDGQVNDVEIHGLNPPTVLVEFENRGTLNAPAVAGRVEVRDQTGNTVDTIPVQSFPVLPGYRRQLTVTSSRKKGDLLPPGNYLILAILDFGGTYLAGGQALLKIEPLHLIPIGDARNPPKDLDGDGLYEDINGDGQLTMDDVALFATHYQDPVVQQNARAFDFNNDGVVDSLDVMALKELVSQQGK
jgi:PKD repeat protein